MVDCSLKGRGICKKMDLIGKVPNMRHGWGGERALKPGGLQGYNGGRFQKSLMEFAKQNLKKSKIKKMKVGDEFATWVAKKSGPGGASMSQSEINEMSKTATASMTPEQYKEWVAAGSSPDAAKQMGKDSKKGDKKKKKT